MEEKTTNELQAILNKTKSSNIKQYFDANQDSIIHSERPFSDYVRLKIKEKGFTQQEIFARAGIPERYGYKLVSMEKKTVQRDVILRMCIAAGLSLKDTQTALTLYGMPVLYAKLPRDAALIITINQRFRNVDRVDEYLAENGFPKLTACGAEDG